MHSKDSVNYGPGHPDSKCGICRYYEKNRYKCTQVYGRIMPEMWCKLFKRKDDSTSQMKTKTFGQW
jgi:hypothetical protein